MLLTKYDRKLHEKTIRQEGWEDGREIGYSEGFTSRQAEIDELKTLMLFRDNELADAKKRIAELEAQNKD